MNISADACPGLDVLASADAAVAAARITARAAAWARRLGPPLDPGLAPLCGLLAAFVAPWTSRPGADLVARTGLWIFALDAWTDGPAARRDPAALRGGVAELRAVAAGAAGSGPLGTGLAEIRDGIAAAPDVPGPWRRSVDAALVGALFEYEAARRVAAGGPPPSLGEYLRHGAASVALAPLVFAMWSGMACPAPVLRALARPLRDACLAVRLANDLSGHRRERGEGVLNALVLGMTPDEARARSGEYVARCRRALRPHIGPLPGPALALERQLLWAVRHYERVDAGHAA
ncbi:terpene synthase family protein [Actinomadura terrae]|uniref:terpene synthase family protein n=1 Tax=Actinomadura terrae TaxID=604353 RepID=UPI001FA77468|nr:terpene synthase family protein [Actinomadura terrae]